MSDYRDAPISISEAKAQRSSDAREWTPRDALVAMLREIDSGNLDPSDLIVMYKEPEQRPSWYMAVKDQTTLVYLIERVKADLMDGE